MRERGIVVRISDGRAAIRLTEGPECSRCGLCHAIGGGEREIEVEAAPNLEPGDAVEIIVEPRSRLRASALVFLIPILAFIGALLIAECCLGGSAHRDPLSLLIGIGAAAGAFTAVAAYDRKLRRRGVELIRVEKVGDDRGQDLSKTGLSGILLG